MYTRIFIVLICILLDTHSGADTLRVVLTDYREASSRLSESQAPPEVRRQFYKEWKQRLVVLASSDVTSPSYPEALKQIVALSNGLGEYEESLKFCTELRSLKSDPVWDVIWTKELGDISHHIHEQKHEKPDLEKAAAFYARTLELLDQLPQPGGTVYRERWFLPVSYRLAEYQRSGLGDHLSAAKAFGRIRQYLDRNGSGSAGTPSGYSYDAFAVAELLEAARGGDWVQTKAVLDAIGLSKRKERYASYYPLLLSTEIGDAARSEAALDILDGWLTGHSEDQGSADLTYSVANLLFSKKRYKSALIKFDHLLVHHTEQMLESSDANLKSQKDGIYAEVLFKAGVCAMELGSKDGAIAYFDKYLQLFSKDDRATYVRTCIESLRSGNFAEGKTAGKGPVSLPERSQSHLLLIVNLVVIFIIITCLCIRKSKKNRAGYPDGLS